MGTIMTTGAVGGAAAVAPVIRGGTQRMAGAAHNIAAAMPQTIQNGTARAAGVGNLVKEKWSTFRS